MRDYAKIDILESGDGDLMVDGGDFAETNIKSVENFAQYVATILQTPKDFIPFPELGIDLGEFIGYFNTPDTAETIRLSIENAITQDGYITKDSIDIEAFPLNETELGLRITGTSLPTSSDEIPRINIFVAYDYLTGRIYALRG